MSAGRFIRAIYESDSGNLYNIRIQPETEGTFNPSAPGIANQETSANAVRRRGNGMFARGISISWLGDPPVAPDGYDPRGRIRIPILTQAVYQNLNVGDEITYLGVPAEITGLLPELRR